MTPAAAAIARRPAADLTDAVCMGLPCRFLALSQDRDVRARAADFRPEEREGHLLLTVKANSDGLYALRSLAPEELRAIGELLLEREFSCTERILHMLTEYAGREGLVSEDAYVVNPKGIPQGAIWG